MASYFGGIGQILQNRMAMNKGRRYPVPGQGAAGGVPHMQYMPGNGSMHSGGTVTVMTKSSSGLDQLFGRFHQSPRKFLPLQPNIQGHYMG